MPVMIIIRASKVTAEQYEAVKAAVGWEQVPPPGAISHSIAFTATGAIEVNIWESQALFDSYVANRLQPVIDRLGVVLDSTEVHETYALGLGAPALPHMLPMLQRPDPAPQGRVLAVFRRSGIPAPLYDSYRARAPIDTVPEGALAHAYGRNGDDILSVDVWDDAAEMMKYIEDQVIPAVEAEGLPFHWPEIVPLHTFVTTPAAKAHERPFHAPRPVLTLA